MIELLDSLIHHIFSIPSTLLFLIIVLSCAFENVPLIGFAVPGQFLLIFAGIAARDHIVDVWLVGLAGVVGGFLGDTIAYELSKRHGKSLVKNYGKHVWIKEEHIETSQAFFNAYGGYALILGRFNPITRWFTPIVAGISSMRPLVFYSYNIISAFLWSFSYIGIGYVFRESYEIVLKYIRNSVIVLLAIGIAFYVLYRFLIVKKINSKIERAVEHEGNK